MRERLIQLLSRYFNIGDSYTYNLTRVKTAFDVGTIDLDDFEEYTEDDVANLADYLLDNGVIVPLVKAGQTVWLIRHNPYEGYVIKENKAVNIGMCFSKNSEVRVTVVTTKEDILGKTVFLTREAAEAALKARDNK